MSTSISTSSTAHTTINLVTSWVSAATMNSQISDTTSASVTEQEYAILFTHISSRTWGPDMTLPPSVVTSVETGIVTLNEAVVKALDPAKTHTVTMVYNNTILGRYTVVGHAPTPIPDHGWGHELSWPWYATFIFLVLIALFLLIITAALLRGQREDIFMELAMLRNSGSNNGDNGDETVTEHIILDKDLGSIGGVLTGTTVYVQENTADDEQNIQDENPGVPTSEPK
ncbi:hypothetical protein AA313_de0208420 [Arthrobotrys entomopaga]|nr:hypothetical protein AA313_de0208420 [Arthrobotrys entomopaga]